MFRKLATIAAFTVIASIPTLSTQAEASRPIPGFQHRDLCSNFAGVQTITDVTVGSYRIKSGTICRRRIRG